MGKSDFDDWLESGDAARRKLILSRGEALMSLRPEEWAALIALLIVVVLLIPAYFRQPRTGPVAEAIQYAEQALRADAAARGIEVAEVEARAFDTEESEEFYLVRLELQFRMRCPGMERWLDFSTVGTYYRESSGWTRETVQGLEGACGGRG